MVVRSSRRAVALRRSLSLIFCIGAVFAIASPAAQAATITVNTTADETANDGNCSLREAVQAANTDTAVDACAAGSGADTITVPSGTYSLASGQLTLNGAVSLVGSGSATTVIDAGGLSRAFHVVGGPAEIAGVTLRNGHVAFPDDEGGAISNDGTLTVRDSVFTANNAIGGGAIATPGGGTLTVIRTTISGNSALEGGAINMLGGTLALRESTVNGNSDTSGTIVTDFCGTISITNSTITGNTTAAAVRGFVCTIVSVASATVSNNTGDGVLGVGATLKNTIVAHNRPDCQGTVSLGHNIDTDNSCGLTAPGDLPSVDPMLGPLADNGGPTQTEALLPGSPAIDAGSADCPPPATDQRGVARAQGPTCDIGAFEVQVTPPNVVTTTNDSGVGSLRAAIAFANSHPGPDTISFAIPTTDLGFNGQWFTIKPQSPLGVLTDGGTTIDGATQTASTGDTNPAGPEVELDGAQQFDGVGFDVSSDANTIEGLAIDNFAHRGIKIGIVAKLFANPPTALTGNVIRANYIGIDPTGATAAPNGGRCTCGGLLSGIVVQDGVDTVIGGPNGSDRNVISGNAGDGVDIFNSSGTRIDGNYIGTNSAGSAAVGNTPGPGVDVSDGATNTVIRANVISGNGQGILVSAGTGTAIRGNRIGTNAAGTAAVGNVGSGLTIFTPNVTVGGPATGDGNVISGNGRFAIALQGGGDLVQGNLIGRDAGDTSDLGNFGGVWAANGNNVIVANVVDASTGKPGVLLSSDGNALRGNRIERNARPGVLVTGSSNVLGGATAGAGNTIASNAGPGVVVASGAGNAISRNSIFSNGGLGIDLGDDGVTPNDPGDADGGPNLLMNFPVLKNANADPATNQTVVNGSIDTPNPTTVTIELFANSVPSPGADPSGFGEGKTFLGTVTPKANGKFVAMLPIVPPGTMISATATDANGNTSEFAADVAVK